ncbi:hypothetical protein CWC18_20915, partial [Pseudoalteromonas aurantia]
PKVRKIALLGKFAYPELRLNTLADKACMPVYHFHRIYRKFTFEPINVTVRRMCLLKAYVMLLRSFMNQQDIAKQVQYGCAAAFNRTFTVSVRQS